MLTSPTIPRCSCYRMKTTMRNLAKIGCCAAVVLIPTSAAAQDLELDFHFLKLGLTRNTVVEMLGPPMAQSKSNTLFIEYRRLIWIGSDGQKYVASFIQNRLWRWKTCTASIMSC